MIDTVITFGDSWAKGDELLDDDKTFGELLAADLFADFKNYSESSSSADQMILQLEKYISERKSQCDLAIFFITDYSRSMTWDKNNCVTEINAYREEYENFYKYVYCDKLGIFRINQTILCLQAICKKFQISDRYVVGWTKFPITFQAVDTDKIYDHGRTTCLE